MAVFVLSLWAKSELKYDGRTLLKNRENELPNMEEKAVAVTDEASL